MKIYLYIFDSIEGTYDRKKMSTCKLGFHATSKRLFRLRKNFKCFLSLKE